MRRAKRISINLFDEELKTLINASAKIFPITQEEVDLNLNPGGYEYGKVGRHIYMWKDGQWDYIIADDVDIKWGDIENKPVEFPPVDHTHDYAPSDHNHDEYYATKSTEDVVPVVDDHETRLLHIESGYASGHVHPDLNVLNTITQEDKDRWDSVVGKAEADHTHTDKADKTYVDTELSKKANITTLTGHTNNSIVHVTQHDKDVWNSKAEGTHVHSQYLTLEDLPEQEPGYSVGTVKPTDGSMWFEII